LGTIKYIKKLKRNSYFNSNSKLIRLLDENGKMLGLFTLKQGIDIAKKKNLDLIEVSSNTNPIVCKIVNMGKYQYFVKKKKFLNSRKNKFLEIKEIRLRPNIATSDLSVKINHAKKFISHGNRVKIVLFFKGRESIHEEFGLSTIKKFQHCCSSF